MRKQRETSFRTPRSSYRLRAGFRLKREWSSTVINFVDEDGIETRAIEMDDAFDDLAEDLTDDLGDTTSEPSDTMDEQ